jgi:hypothetical protein
VNTDAFGMDIWEFEWITLPPPARQDGLCISYSVPKGVVDP